MFQKQQQQDFLEALNSAEEDGTNGENATRLINGSLVYRWQVIEPEDEQAAFRQSPPLRPLVAGTLSHCPDPSPYLSK